MPLQQIYSCANSLRVFICIIFSMAFANLTSSTLQASSEFTQADRKKAEQYFFAGKYYAALDYFKKVSTNSPEDYRAHRLAGDASMALGKYPEAKEFFMRAEEFSPNPELDWFRLGQANYLHRNGVEALKYLKRAAPKISLALFYMGLCEYKIKGDIPETIRFWEEYVATQPPDEKVVREAIEILKRKKNLPLVGSGKESGENEKTNPSGTGESEATQPSAPPPLIDQHISPTELISPN